MRIEINEGPPAADDGIEVVERKGLGHPDTLADLLAESFSQQYSVYGLERFGRVPNHWVDKTALIGARSHVDYGGYTVQKPISAYLFGKLTEHVGLERIPTEELFRRCVNDVLPAATGAPDIAAHVERAVENTAGTAADHPTEFYRPSQDAQLGDDSTPRSNDTVLCSARAPQTGLARLALDVENFAVGQDLRADLPTGTDVKVMLFRVGPSVELTVCLPVHPDRVASKSQYTEVMEEARARLSAYACARAAQLDGLWHLDVVLNSKDQEGGAYLAPWGTSLGKGDCGLVGRGNRANGVIAADTGTGGEAIAGKNPVHHAGKLYTLVAERIAHRIGLENQTLLVSRNGDRIDRPAFVGIRTRERTGEGERRRIADIVEEEMTGLPRLSKWLLTTPVIDRFRRPELVLEA